MNIITVENENLRGMCMPVLKGEKAGNINHLVNSMVKLMLDNHGCGIAAPQVGVHKRLFVAIIDDEIELFINPTILSHSKNKEVDTEGCLSVPDMRGDVERYKTIKIQYFNGKQVVTKKYEGLNARIVQHEYDHLNGVLYIDKAENIQKIQVEEEE